MVKIDDYKLLGYILTECNLTRVHGVAPDKVKISILNYNFSIPNGLFTISYLFELTTEGNNTGRIIYDALFTIPELDKEFRDEYKTLSGQSNTDMSSELFEKIQAMVQMSFPYVRQALANMTNDFGGAISIPLINSKELIKTSIEFSKLPSSPQNKAAKKVVTKSRTAK